LHALQRDATLNGAESALSAAARCDKDHAMSCERQKAVVLDEEFLPLRAKILEVAAGLDRLDRASGKAAGDDRRERLEQAIRQLLEHEPTRAERVQLLFSRKYDGNWRQEFNL
jgi:hypothetical protein